MAPRPPQKSQRRPQPTMPKRRRGGTPAAKRAEPKNTADAAPDEGAFESHDVKPSASDAAKTSSSKRMRKAAVRKSPDGTKRAADGVCMPVAVVDAGTSSSSPSADEQAQQHLQTLQRLDEEYIGLDAMEAILRRDLNRLQQDEQRIRRAMQLSSETPAERREREASERDQKALERLEFALMEDEDGNDGDDGESNADHGVNDDSISATKNRSEDSTAAAEAKGGIDDGKDDDTLGGISVSDLPAYI